MGGDRGQIGDSTEVATKLARLISRADGNDRFFRRGGRVFPLPSRLCSAWCSKIEMGGVMPIDAMVFSEFQHQPARRRRAIIH